MLPKLIRNRTWALAGAAALALAAPLPDLVTPVYTTVTLTYAEDPSPEKSSRPFSPVPGENVTASDARSRVVNSGVARISWLDLKVWEPLLPQADRPGGSGLQRRGR